MTEQEISESSPVVTTTLSVKEALEKEDKYRICYKESISTLQALSRLKPRKNFLKCFERGTLAQHHFPSNAGE